MELLRDVYQEQGYTDLPWHYLISNGQLVSNPKRQNYAVADGQVWIGRDEGRESARKCFEMSIGFVTCGELTPNQYFSAIMLCSTILYRRNSMPGDVVHVNETRVGVAKVDPLELDIKAFRKALTEIYVGARWIANGVIPSTAFRIGD